MRYLVFGDVHGNLPALEKMLEKEKNNYDQLISHGDVVNYGPWSNECVEMLSGFSDIITLKGNHENSFLNGSYPGDNEIAKTFFKFCYPKFDKTELIRNYDEYVDLKNFQVKHTVNNTYLYPDTDLSSFTFENNYIIGHSHYQFDRLYRNKRIVNTGSVGQNRKFINVVEYILYDDTTDSVELRSFNYNVDYVISKMEAEHYPQLCVDYYRSKKRKQ